MFSMDLEGYQLLMETLEGLTFMIVLNLNNFIVQQIELFGRDLLTGDQS